MAVGEGAATVGGTVAVDDGNGEAVAVRAGSSVDVADGRGDGSAALGAGVAVDNGNGEGEGMGLGNAVDVGCSGISAVGVGLAPAAATLTGSRARLRPGSSQITATVTSPPNRPSTRIVKPSRS